MTTEVRKDERVFRVHVWPWNGYWTYDVAEQRPDGKTVKMGEGISYSTRFVARWAARRAIRAALKGDEWWTVRAERHRG